MKRYYIKVYSQKLRNGHSILNRGENKNTKKKCLKVKPLNERKIRLIYCKANQNRAIISTVKSFEININIGRD